MTYAHAEPLDSLYARLDAVVGGRETLGDAWSAHTAVLDRLEANRREAEANGWTSCALERAGMAGHFRMYGLPPASRARAEVPDLALPGDDASSPRDGATSARRMSARRP